ncbi:hypothetical protein [Nocardiopsis sp. LOL_012]|uniref:hypothetical protein n=1 Tax=Nocardiopsis sp. LOL_012 TaxID=3345409 RepID=UPI003A8AFEBD
MHPNPWTASDRHTDTETDRLDWLWTVLYDTIRDMLVCLPTPVRIPHLTTATKHTAADTLRAVCDDDLWNQNIPNDIRALADCALTGAVLALNATSTERRHLTEEAQARTRAVVAYIGVGPEEAGAADTWEEITV